MEIIKRPELNEKEVKAMEVLTSGQKSFIMALNDFKLLSLSKDERVKEIYKNLKIAEIDSGLTKLLDSDLVSLSFSIEELIADKYQNLTITELKLSFKNGVICNYGEWFGICLKTINQWIKGYINNEARASAIKEWNANIIKSETSNVPIQKQIYFSKESSLRSFETYKIHKKMPMSAFAYYDLINEMQGVYYNGVKTLITDKEQRKNIVAKCEKEFEWICLKLKNKSLNNGNLNSSEQLMDSIINPKGNKSFDRMVKEAFLKQYFDNLIKENKELFT